MGKNGYLAEKISKQLIGGSGYFFLASYGREERDGLRRLL